MIFRSEDRPDDGDQRVCYCMHVDRSTLVEAIADGATTLEALRERTRAGTGCGTCRIDLLALLAEFGCGKGPKDDRP